DLCAWQQGVADFHARPTAERLGAACVALAKLHRAWQINHGSMGPCPGVRRRLDALQDWQAPLAGGWRPVLAANDPIRPAAERALAVLRDGAPVAQRRLAPWPDVPLPIPACWCAPWQVL